ncbi:MAG: hypothetical protein MUO58_09025 [Anaerolineales bacterium]|nr:hypothetical protein [Anaerolineales bacterium]
MNRAQLQPTKVTADASPAAMKGEGYQDGCADIDAHVTEVTYRVLF